jgi:predicted DNA-binding antitoxin AbrB/MazE fold protein
VAVSNTPFRSQSAADKIREEGKMNQIITATFEDGVFKPDDPLTLPSGTRVRLLLGVFKASDPSAELDRVCAEFPIETDGTRLSRDELHERTLGVRDEDWPTDPEGIARHLALMDKIEPLEMTPQEEAEWLAARKAQKEHDLIDLALSRSV